MTQQQQKTVLALDVGGKRIGVARAFIANGFPAPCTVVQHDDTVLKSLDSLVTEESAVAVVVGLPRSLDGNETAQTKEVRAFTDRLKGYLKIPIYLQDEAGTSRKAEAELRKAGGKRKGPSSSVDALAATYILEDFINEAGNRELLNKIN